MFYDVLPDDLYDFIFKNLDGAGLEVVDEESMMQAIIENFDQLDPEFILESYLADIDDESYD